MTLEVHLPGGHWKQMLHFEISQTQLMMRGTQQEDSRLNAHLKPSRREPNN